MCPSKPQLVLIISSILAGAAGVGPTARSGAGWQLLRGGTGAWERSSHSTGSQLLRSELGVVLVVKTSQEGSYRSVKVRVLAIYPALG